MSAAEKSVALHFAGRVQGVGFRAFVRRLALERGLRGYVRNLRDGRVEVVAIGAESDVAAFEAKARIGPWGAKVEAVESFEPGASEDYRGFDVRF